jgi:hypothetical protein
MVGSRLTFQLACLAALWCCGCGVGSDMPRDRLGALPFPGHMSLYATADPAHLGRHRYERMPRALGKDEKERGIIYTTRAGFIDLAHVRIAIDWTRHCTRLAHAALADGRTALAVEGPDHGVFHLTLDYPDRWADLPAEERGRVIDDRSRWIGQRLTYLMLTWHEVATWFGYRTFFFDESPSAFTYDDTVATLLGMRVAARAMAERTGNRDRDFDAAATMALAAELGRLGPVTPAQTDEAVAAVKGLWWSDAGPLKRQTEVWPGEVEVVHPWLVPNLPFAEAEGEAEGEAETFALPCERGPVDARTMVAVHITIEPRIKQAAAMRAMLKDGPAWFNEERDVLALINVMRGQMRERYGAEFSQPWPAVEAMAHSAK